MNHSTMDHSKMGHGTKVNPNMAIDMGMNMDMGNNTMMDMMKMYFHTDLSGDYLFFKEFKLDSVGKMVGACFVVIILAILYEVLKMLREHLFTTSSFQLRYLINDLEPSQPISSVQSNLIGDNNVAHCTKKPSVRRIRIFSWPHVLQTFLHTLQVLLAYLLMLVFMTYSVWLCLAVLIGAAMGYFIFGWKRSLLVDISDHCH